MKKLVLTKETIRDLSRPELEAVAGGDTAPPGPKCCYTTGGTLPELCTGWETCGPNPCLL